MEARNAIAEIMKREGVEFLFCFPNSPIIDAAAGAEIRPVVARMERCAVNMADGYTRTLNGRRTGVLTVQAGPGIENAFGGIAQAYADSTPMLVLPGHAGTGKLGIPSDFSGRDNYRHVTKWAELINSPQRVPEMMRRAFTALRSGRPSPVMLEVPGDVALAEVDDTVDYTPVRPIRSGRRPAGRGGRGAGVAGGDAAPDLCGARLPLCRGHGRTGGTGGASAGPGDDHHAGQERLPREPSAGPRRRRQHPDPHGQPLPRQVRPRVRHRYQLPENAGVGGPFLRAR